MPVSTWSASNMRPSAEQTALENLARDVADRIVTRLTSQEQGLCAAQQPDRHLRRRQDPEVDRIELVWMLDPQTAMQALINGEIDYYEQPPVDFIPILEKAKG